MKAVATLDSTISGNTASEHSGHYVDGVPVHPTSVISGTISSNVSPFVFINSKPIAFNNSVTTEKDNCCGSSLGKVTATTSLLKHNGTPVARLNDPVQAHNGSAKVTSASSFVFSE